MTYDLKEIIERVNGADITTIREYAQLVNDELVADHTNIQLQYSKILIDSLINEYNARRNETIALELKQKTKFLERWQELNTIASLLLATAALGNILTWFF